MRARMAMAAAVFLLVWPVYTGFEDERPTHATLVRVNRAWVIIPVMFPVLVAQVPLVVRKRAVWIVAAIVMSASAVSRSACSTCLRVS